MGGSTRSRSRSTTVLAATTGGHRKSKKPKDTRKIQTTWDHDNSSASDADNAEPPAAKSSTTISRNISHMCDASEITAPAKGQKRLLEDAQRMTTADDEEDLKLAKKASKRPRQPGRREGSSDADGSEERNSGSEGSAGESEEGARKEMQAASEGSGMGDVMARILGQKVDTRQQAPVLAKRKTKVMKEMEAASAKRAESRSKSAARREKLTQQFVIPDHTTADYERQMKKIATRGVVALFNAISKRQADGSAGADLDDKRRGTGNAAAVKSASRQAFLDMLKTGVKPVDMGAGTGGIAKGEEVRGPSGAGGVTDQNTNAAEKAGGGRSWSVLQDDYMLGPSSMKNWDQESEESEVDALAEGSGMSEDSD